MPSVDRLASLAAIPPKALTDLIKRMREAEDTSKAHFTLPELLAEAHRRQKVGIFPTIETARKIIELVRESSSGVINYLDIWQAFRPGEPWQAHKSRQEVTNALDRVAFYCTRHHLPLLVTLVVNRGKGALTDEAKSNIFHAARERGMETGLGRDAFILNQQRESRELALMALPDQE